MKNSVWMRYKRGIIMDADLKELPGPYEILELNDGQTLELQIKSYSTGSVTIYPAHAPGGKVIAALRLHVSKRYKPYFPWYWDVTSKFLVAQLLGYLEAGDFQNKRFVITKHGTAPKARFELQVIPI